MRPYMKAHILKTDPLPFDAVVRGDKTFEIRYDDRGYQVGDILVLWKTRYSSEEMKAGKPLEYTGAKYTCQVTHIQTGYGIESGYVILSISKQRDVCYKCKKLEDCRPYGENGQQVCFSCATSTPEAEAKAAEQSDALEEASTPQPRACPFCRREEADVHYDHKYDTHYVRCNNFMCNTRGPSAGSRETALNLWNKQGG